MHKHLRIFILLLILLIISVGTLVSDRRITDWSHTLRVVVYPINGDHSPISTAYIDDLTKDNFSAINRFLSEELEHYNVSLSEPIDIDLSAIVNELPPKIPVQGNAFDIMLWSLKLRYWAFTRDEYQGPKPEIQLFALYYDPKKSPKIKHSTGLKKGHMAIINLFADKRQKGSNLFIMTHELLHTLGATDKYNLATNEPIYPYGFAEPDLSPLYPQTYAEIMGGRIPINKNTFEIPSSLDKALIGEQTAKEIRLIE